MGYNGTQWSKTQYYRRMRKANCTGKPLFLREKALLGVDFEKISFPCLAPLDDFLQRLYNDMELLRK